MTRNLNNPILPGFYPDPSICRVGEDYYLVTSSFEYFPGLPLFHSRDLVHWHQLGHVLDRPSQLPLEGICSSDGLYAPTIRHHNGVFYVINTLVGGKTRSGNFIVTACDPAGPWSEPYWLEGASGIDPSLFFDEDGRAWYTGTTPAFAGWYEGHTQVWLQELDLASMRLVGDPKILWDGALKGGIWSEAPHIYKYQGYYYLVTAEGGTAHHHSVMAARSQKVTGPYVGNPGNPILTHRQLGLDYPIVGAGHADLVQTQSGEWWMVLLAMRPYGGYYYNLGRETFLAPLRWEDGWPVVSPGTGRLEFSYPVPNLPEKTWPEEPARDDFDAPVLAPHWNFLRVPHPGVCSLVERPGTLRLHLLPQRLSEPSNPAFIGRRQQHINFETQTALEFTPQAENECAGMVLLQSNEYHFRIEVTRDAIAGNGTSLRLIQRIGGVEEVLVESMLNSDRCLLKVRAIGQAYSFYYMADGSAEWRTLAERLDGRILSTPVAGGFLGAFIGMYASSNGQASTNHADFDWFGYTPLPEKDFK